MIFSLVPLGPIELIGQLKCALRMSSNVIGCPIALQAAVSSGALTFARNYAIATACIAGPKHRCAPGFT